MRKAPRAIAPVTGRTIEIRDQPGGAVSDVLITSPMEYGTIMLVSLDGKPLATSGRMLLQVMSEDKNNGWKEETKTDQWKNKSQSITDLGAAPVIVKNFAGVVTLTRPDAAELRVTALDHNGYPAEKLPDGKAIALQPKTIYYLVEK